MEKQGSGDVVEEENLENNEVEEIEEEGEEENSFVEIQNKLGDIAEKFGKDLEEINKCF